MNHDTPQRILVMDDEETILQMMTTMLAGRGYEPVTAADGAEALEKFRQAQENGTPFYAVILDVAVNNGMGALETMPELLKIDPDVKVIIASGYAGDPMLDDYRNLGVQAVIAKPFRPQQIVDLINSL